MVKRNSHQTLILSFLLAPCTIAISLLVVAPLIYVGIISFLKFSPTDLWINVFTLENYKRFFFDSFYLNIIWITVKVGLITTLVCAILGYPLAYFLARTHSKHIEIFIFLLISPLMISTVIRIFGWIVLLGKQGVINKFLLLLPMVTEPIGILQTLPAVIIGIASILLPYMVLPLMSAIESIPKSVEEAASNLGANRFQIFLKILLPLSIPGLVSGSILVYLISISALIVPALMGMPKVRMLGNQVYDAVLVSFNWPFAASISIIMIFFTFTILGFYLKWVRK